MKTFASLTLAAVSFSLAASSVFARPGEHRGVKGAEPRAALAALQAPRPAKAGDAESSNRSSGPLTMRVRYLLVNLGKLQKAMDSQLAMTPAQAAAVDKLFEQYSSAVRERGGPNRPFGVGQGDAEAFEKLRRDLSAARTAGDEKKLAALSAKFKEQLRSRQRGIGTTLDHFFSRVANELADEQREIFRDTIERLRIGDDRPPMPRELTRIKKVLSNPVLQLAPGKRRTLYDILDEGSVKVATAEANGSDREPVIEEVRASVFAELTNRQANLVALRLRFSGNRSRARKQTGMIRRMLAERKKQAPAEAPKKGTREADAPKPETPDDK